MDDERRRVLVAADDPDVRLLCGSSLASEGYDVVEVGDGEEALRRAREQGPHVVVLEVVLSGLDGWQVLAALRADPELRDIPVVLLGADAADGDQIRGWPQGAADVLAKPFSPLALSQVLQDVLATTPDEAEQRRMTLELPGLLDNP